MSGGTWPLGQWTDVASGDEVAITRMRDAFRLADPAARVLVARGHNDPVEAANFLRPMLRDCLLPDRLPGIAQAASRIGEHVGRGDEIVVFGDFDADGMTAATILKTALYEIGAKASIFIPDRQREGYGFTETSLARCRAEHPAAKLIVTVDCGISHAHACDLAVADGIEVIVTDHHEVSRETLPKSASVLVNPCLEGTPEALRHLCGAGVSFKLAHELVRRFLPASEGPRIMRPLIAIAAVGTIGDLVPLLGENRIIASRGLDILNHASGGELVGLKVLCDSAGIRGDVDATALAFVVVPRINAAGRVGDPEYALRLLASRNPAEARALAQRLNEFNRQRRAEESAAVRDAEAELSSRTSGGSALILSNTCWHLGVIGLVASRLSSRRHRPTIVFAADNEAGCLRGSARCPEIPGLDLMQLLTRTGGLVAQGGLLQSFGGHRAAAGLTLACEDLEAFRERFEGVCEEAERGLDMRPECRIEAWIRPEEADARLAADVARIGPFGTLNPVPLLALRGVTLASDPACFGRGRNNWRIELEETPVPAILFGQEELPFHKGDRIDMVFHFSRDMYESLQLFVKDLRRAELSELC